MLIAAGLVALYVAYFFGLRVGAWCGAIAAGMFFVAAVVPLLAPIIYLASVVGLAAVAVLGPRNADSARRRRHLTIARRQLSRVWKNVRR